jgi:hypothetical protein
MSMRFAFFGRLFAPPGTRMFTKAVGQGEGPAVAGGLIAPLSGASAKSMPPLGVGRCRSLGWLYGGDADPIRKDVDARSNRPWPP